MTKSLAALLWRLSKGLEMSLEVSFVVCVYVPYVGRLLNRKILLLLSRLLGFV